MRDVPGSDSLERTDGPPRDSVLLERVATGDRQAPAALWARYSASLYALALAILSDPAEAQEIVDATFREVRWEARHSIRLTIRSGAGSPTPPARLSPSAAGQASVADDRAATWASPACRRTSGRPPMPRTSSHPSPSSRSRRRRCRPGRLTHQP